MTNPIPMTNFLAASAPIDMPQIRSLNFWVNQFAASDATIESSIPTFEIEGGGAFGST